MHSHTGNPPLAAFTCDVSGVTVSGGSNKQCFLEDVVAADTVEYEFCARRGVCDFTAGTFRHAAARASVPSPHAPPHPPPLLPGLCYCLEGYTGEACTGQSYVYVSLLCRVYLYCLTPRFQVLDVQRPARFARGRRRQRLYRERHRGARGKGRAG
jgi:hypothetical protein